MNYQKAILVVSNMVDAQFGSVPGYFQDTLELRKRSPCDFAGKFLNINHRHLLFVFF